MSVRADHSFRYCKGNLQLTVVYRNAHFGHTNRATLSHNFQISNRYNRGTIILLNRDDFHFNVQFEFRQNEPRKVLGVV